MLLAAAFVGVGLWMVGMFGEVPTSERYPSEATAVAVGVSNILVFSLSFAFWTKLFFDRRVQLRVDEDGIFCRKFSSGLIAWDNISTWHRAGFGLNRTVAVDVINDTELLQNAGQKLLSKFNRKMGFLPIYLPVLGLDTSLDELVDTLKAFAPVHLSRPSPE